MTNRIGRLTFVIWFPFDAKGERHWGEADFAPAPRTREMVTNNGTRLVSQNKSITKITVGLSRREDTNPLADRLAAVHFDVLINNAGSGLYGRFEKIPLHD